MFQTEAFREWLASLRDRQAVQRIGARLLRMAGGNAGDVKSVGDGVTEARLDFGPGYRVYFGRRGDVLIILLTGGDKNSQTRDIETAKAMWRSWKAENDE